MRISDIREAIVSLEARMDLRFEQIDQRFALIDQRFVAIDQRFVSIDQRFTGIDDRLDRLSSMVWSVLVAVVSGTISILAVTLQS